jgi:hypothetical protein
MNTTAPSPSRFGLIVGAMKCGTTSLFNYLAAHPEVAPCRTKEPDYFSSADFQSDDSETYFSLWDWDPSVHKIAIEASANYTKIPTNPNCADRIAQFSNCDFRFIYCMRNPIDRIESHVYHGLYAGWTQPLEEGISDHALNVSRYAMQLDAYVERFGRDRILLVVLEEFQKTRAEGFRRICEFLEIDPDFELADHGTHNPSSDHYIERPLWNRIRGVEPLRRLAQRIPSGLRRLILRSTGRRIDARKRLTPSERAEVSEALQGDLARLQSDYGIDAERTWGIQLR